MNDPFYNRDGDNPTSQNAPSPAWWAAQRGGPGAALSYLAGSPLDDTVSDYMWNTVGIQNWITQGGHMTDDWIESSCLTGQYCDYLLQLELLADESYLVGLTAPAPCPSGDFPECGAPDF
ncbi:hypothetical protein MMC28_010680 [Mycoblastus sanguinarius]|nr:hypothetical protein [Mycoblastus sanguinarius]